MVKETKKVEEVKETPKLTKEQEAKMLEQAKISSCMSEVNEILKKYNCGIRTNHTPEVFIIKEQ